MNISFSNSAVSDLDGIKQYYLEQGVPDIGLNFIADIIKNIESLSSQPKMGRLVPEFNDSSIRELIRPPFRIVYLCGVNNINIIRVWRSERLLKLD